MQSPTLLLALTLIVANAEHAKITAQSEATYAAAPAVADSPVTVRWNRLVPGLVAENAARRKVVRAAAVAAHDSATLRQLALNQPPLLFRLYSLLSVAQYAAVNSASGNRAVSSDAAIAAASAGILHSLYPDSAVRASIARELDRDLARARTKSRSADIIAAGQRLGDDVATRVLAWAPAAPTLVGPWNGTIPTGPGMWYSAKGVPPIGVLVSQARPWLLDSASQLRPPPPPAYGSPEWQAALAEVKKVGRERTAWQTHIARIWNDGDPLARWNDIASSAILRHHMNDVDAARVLAVMNVGASDAIIACFDAKYHYWTIRPSQADTTIVLADSVGLPNFPSYPSGHACGAGALEAALDAYFPQDQADFAKIAEEEAMSRLYGGIHYRFDNDGGLALGRKVARYDVDQEKRGKLNAWKTVRIEVKQ